MNEEQHIINKRIERNQIRLDTLTEVEKMIDIFKINIWKDRRCFEGIKCKTCLPLDYINEHIDKLEIELNRLKEKKE